MAIKTLTQFVIRLCKRSKSSSSRIGSWFAALKDPLHASMAEPRQKKEVVRAPSLFFLKLAWLQELVGPKLSAKKYQRKSDDDAGQLFANTRTAYESWKKLEPLRTSFGQPLSMLPGGFNVL